MSTLCLNCNRDYTDHEEDENDPVPLFCPMADTRWKDSGLSDVDEDFIEQRTIEKIAAWLETQDRRGTELSLRALILTIRAGTWRNS